MGLRFQKRVNLGGGSGINISKSGASYSQRTKWGSVGTTGFSIRTGIPGVSYRSNWDKNAGSMAAVLVLFYLVFGIFILAWKILKYIFNGIEALFSGKKTSQKQLNKLSQQIISAYEAGNIQKVIELAPDYPGTDVLVLQYIGVAYMQEGQEEKGIYYFRKALEICKAESETILGYKIRITLASALFNAKNYKTAISVLQKIEEEWVKFFNDTDDFRIPLIMGLSFIEMEQYELAIKSFQKAPIRRQRVNKSLNDIFLLIAESYEHLGNKKSALQYYQKALSNDINLIKAEEKIKELSA